MTLDEAIEHAEKVAEGCGPESAECAKDHRRLAGWLRELRNKKAAEPLELLTLERCIEGSWSPVGHLVGPEYRTETIAQDFSEHSRYLCRVRRKPRWDEEVTEVVAFWVRGERLTPDQGESLNEIVKSLPSVQHELARSWLCDDGTYYVAAKTAHGTHYPTAYVRPNGEIKVHPNASPVLAGLVAEVLKERVAGKPK